MPIEKRNHIQRADLQAEPETLFIFGDNLARGGLGGQAKEMRGEPNAVGLPTKHSPWEFLTDADLPKVIDTNRAALAKLQIQLFHGKKVVVSSAGIGSGLAELKTKAPLIHDYYQHVFYFLEQVAHLGGG